jgi:hypothetical protein
MASRLLRVNILSPITGSRNPPWFALPQLIHDPLQCKMPSTLVSMLWRVRIHAYHSIPAMLISLPELVQNEDKFKDIRDALKTLNKMDFDKLIVSVRIHPHFPAQIIFSLV